MTTQLPPFSGDHPRCAKCAYRSASTEWLPAHIVDGAELAPERLSRSCDRCDYGWDEAISPPTAA